MRHHWIMHLQSQTILRSPLISFLDSLSHLSEMFVLFVWIGPRSLFKSELFVLPVSPLLSKLSRIFLLSSRWSSAFFWNVSLPCCSKSFSLSFLHFRQKSLYSLFSKDSLLSGRTHWVLPLSLLWALTSPQLSFQSFGSSFF